VSVNKKIWEKFRKKTPNASDALERFMTDYQPPTSNDSSVIQVNKDVWQNFYDKYQSCAIQEVERLLQLAVSSPSPSTNIMSVNTSFVNSMSIPSAGNWTVNYSNNSINLTQTTSTGTLTNYTTTGATTSTPDILIDFNGDIK